MADMTRRLFLGTVASAAGASMVVQASEADIAQYARGMPVAVQDTPNIPAHGNFAPPEEVGQMVFDHKGRVIGVIVGVEQREAEQTYIEEVTTQSAIKSKRLGLWRPPMTIYQVIAQGVIAAPVSFER